MDELVRIAKALSDPNRVRALLALEKGERCVCEIIRLLELAPSTVSKHMSLLRNAGLVKSRKQGRWIYFSLRDAETSGLVSSALEWVTLGLKKDATVASDREKLRNPNKDKVKMNGAMKCPECGNAKGRKV